MRDPFLPNRKTQLVREAQIGLSVVAIVLSLFLYVAFYKITGRGRHLPDHVRNAPIAETVWPDANPSNELAMTPKRFEERANILHTSIASQQSSQAMEVDRPSSHAAPKFEISKASPQTNVATTKSKTGSLSSRGSSGIEFASIPKSRPQLPVTNRSQAATRKIPTRNKSLANRLGSLIGLGKKEVDAKQEIANRESVQLDNSQFPSNHQSDFVQNKHKPDGGLQSPSNMRSVTPVMDLSTEVAHADSPNSRNRNAAAIPNELRRARPGAVSSKAMKPEALIPSTTNNDFQIQLTSTASTERSREANEPIVNSNRSTEKKSRLRSSKFESPLRPDLATSKKGVHLPASRPSASFPMHSALDMVEVSLDKSKVEMPAANSLQRDANQLQTGLNRQPPTINGARPTAYTPTPLPQRLPRPVSRTDVGEIPSNGQLPKGLRPELQNSMRPSTYVAREGDSFWSVAQGVYDDPRFFSALFKYNQAIAPNFDTLAAGTRLQTPLKSELRKLYPTDCPAEDSEQVNADSATESVASLESRFYVTRAGDTLWEIAGDRLGQASRYLDIYKANQVRLDAQTDPNRPLPAGVRLVLPIQKLR